MKSGDARVALIGFPSVGKVSQGLGGFTVSPGCALQGLQGRFGVTEPWNGLAWEAP